MASQNGHVDTVKVLLKAGVNVNQANTTYGASPLLVASEHGNLAIVKVLLKAVGMSIK
jgi:ankyrin repeat protein